jgi:hypothetical protein
VTSSEIQRADHTFYLQPNAGRQARREAEAQQKTQLWRQHYRPKQLPGPYVLLPFTVPESLRPLLRSHPQIASHALFQASAEALPRLATAARCIGTDLPGCPGILHPWGRQLQYHPHLPSIVPGGGLSKDRPQWRPSRDICFVPLKALSPSSRALCKPAMAKAARRNRLAPQVWHTNWHGPRPANPHGAPAGTYLAP